MLHLCDIYRPTIALYIGSLHKAIIRETMDTLLKTGLTFGALIVALIIVGAMAAKSYTVGKDASGNNTTLVDKLYVSSTGALTTFSDFLPVIAIAIVGGLALMYLFGFLGGTSGNRR